MHMSISIEQIRDRIIELENELHELRVTLKVMEKYTNETPVPKELPSAEKGLPLENGVLNLDALNLPTKDKPKKNTLLDDVRSIIVQMGEHEFTVAHVEAALKQIGKATESSSFRNRVAISIKKILDDESLIEKTYEGGGKEPHRYKLLPKQD